MKHTYIIIDDEERCINVLKQYGQQFGNLIEINTYSNPLLALLEISEMEEKVDVIFMDVEMPEMGGVELSKKIRHKTHRLIFTTAYSKYAFDAYQLQVEAYLLKPFSYIKFVEEVTRVLPERKKEEDEYILVKDNENNNTLVRMNFKDVFAFESNGNYIKIHSVLFSNPVISYLTLKEVLKILEDKQANQYIQVQRAFIVSTQHIQSIKGKQITMPNELLVNIGDYYRANLEEYLEKMKMVTNRK